MKRIQFIKIILLGYMFIVSKVELIQLLFYVEETRITVRLSLKC